MQTEKAVKIDRRALAALPRPRNRDGRPNSVVILFAERHNHVQAVGSSALEEHDELFLVRHRSGRHGTLEKCGNRAHADHCHAAAFQENAPRNIHGHSPLPPAAIKTTGNGSAFVSSHRRWNSGEPSTSPAIMAAFI